MSKIGEYILRRLGRDPNVTIDYTNPIYELKHRDVEACIRSLDSTFPEIRSIVRNKKVLDVGCSEGVETLALAMMGASEVHGIDIRIDENVKDELLRQSPNYKMTLSIMDAHNTKFCDGEFDVVVTCGSFEHFRRPDLILKEIKRILRPDGRVLLTSGVWSQPWGAHMNFFTRVPWVQYAFSEDTIMSVRRLYRTDGAKKFSEVEGGLNKMGIRSFCKLVAELGLSTEYLWFRPVKGLSMLTKVPYLNEFFTNLIVAVVRNSNQSERQG